MARSDGVFETLLVHSLTLNGRRGESRSAIGVMWVVVVAVDVATVANFAFETVDREVQATEASGFVGFLYALDGEFCSGILFVLRDEARGLDEHATGTARRVENAP